MNSIYKIKIKGVFGAAYAQYHNGILKMFINELDGKPELNFNLELPETWNLKPGTKVEELKPKTLPDKVALFCMLYKTHKRVAYRVMKQEISNLRSVQVNEALLNLYFSNTSYPLSVNKTISDYVRHYNHVRDLVTNGVPVKSRFPDVYDREFERTLEGETLSAYWQHLNKLGWKKIDGSWRPVTY